MAPENRCSIKQLADTLEISKDTVLRAIQKGELKAEFGSGPAGAQYWLELDQAREWWENRKNRKPSAEPPEENPDPQEPPAAPEAQTTQPVLASAIEVFTMPSATQTVSMEVHLQALRLVERAQMHVETLQIELHSTRKALTAQSESLLQQQLLEQKAEELTQQNARQKELWEAEKRQLLEELGAHQNRANGLEKRVPRWVRRVFGATGT